MMLGQLDPNTEPAWWVRETRVQVTSDGRIVFDPLLWWPMEVIKRIGRAWRSIRYSTKWKRGKLPYVANGKVRTYARMPEGYPRCSTRVWNPAKRTAYRRRRYA